MAGGGVNARWTDARKDYKLDGKTNVSKQTSDMTQLTTMVLGHAPLSMCDCVK